MLLAMFARLFCWVSGGWAISAATLLPSLHPFWPRSKFARAPCKALFCETQGMLTEGIGDLDTSLDHKLGICTASAPVGSGRWDILLFMPDAYRAMLLCSAERSGVCMPLDCAYWSGLIGVLLDPSRTSMGSASWAFCRDVLRPSRAPCEADLCMLEDTVSASRSDMVRWLVCFWYESSLVTAVSAKAANGFPALQ